MKNKKIFSLLITLVMISGMVFPVNAHNRKEHDQLLELVLFGGLASDRLSTDEAKQALKALKKASYLTLDQFNGKGKDDLRFLEETYKVKNLPESIDEIDFTGNQYHRTYTHRGWNYIYPIDKAHWSIRKKILMETTEKIFDFQFIPNKILGFERPYDEKCESFAAIVYYVHVLGDQQARDSYKSKELMIPLARANPGPDNPDIIGELQKYISILFQEQKDTSVYKSLLLEMNSLAIEARSLASTVGGINNDEKFDEFHSQVDELFSILQRRVPLLLAKEEFFTDIFSRTDISDAA